MHGPLGVDLILICDVLVRCQTKPWFLEGFAMLNPNQTNCSKAGWEASMAWTAVYLCWPGSWGRPRARPESRYNREAKKPFGEFWREGGKVVIKNKGSNTPVGQRLGEFVHSTFTVLESCFISCRSPRGCKSFVVSRRGMRDPSHAD